MRKKASHFKSFIVVHPGGGTRRSRRIPKRKNPGTLVDTKSPTPQEVDTTFENYLKTMSKGGAYGDNLEIVAFANVFQVDICIYSEEAGAFWYCNCDDAATKTAYLVHHVSVPLHCRHSLAYVVDRHGSTTPPFEIPLDLMMAFPVSSFSTLLRSRPRLRNNSPTVHMFSRGWLRRFCDVFLTLPHVKWLRKPCKHIRAVSTTQSRVLCQHRLRAAAGALA